MATTSLPPSVARLRDAVSVDRNIDAPLYSTRRRLGVLAFVLLGAALLGVSLSVTPGDTAFYPLTLGLAATWIVGAVVTGPLPAGRFSLDRSAGSVSNAVWLGVIAGAALGAVFVVGAFLTRLIPPLSDLVSQVLAFADYGSIGVVTAITLINGAAEELFFRGAVYSAVRPYHPILVSTVVYVIATLASGNVMLGFAAILLGSLCAVLRRCTGGIVAPVCTHVVWSTIVLFALPPIFN
ncbi:CPBP family intramembrane metalloprotease [Gordonia otitidis]|uniref:CPBP family intramembrane glutamic endopeptidase n=1 Tax=Gordonia otitidis TaxID=249058 RepID=UPI001D14CC9C|nr:CPBP family intramembrane glutamic endopeptidase [Gordonia otitidis]UEA58608.1 CPBP family intramembrane metalloprotease [Gordonia otitidis]